MFFSDGVVNENGMIDVQVGGGMTGETVREIVVPALAAFLSGHVREEPDGMVGEYLRDSVDCACDDTIDGCEAVVNQAEDCRCWGGFIGQTDNDPAITATEIRCNALYATVLRPDIDVDGDMVPDLLSVGFQFSAIPVTIDN